MKLNDYHLLLGKHFNRLGTFTFCKSEKIINIHEVAKLLLDDETINAGTISLSA